ncbi:MAG TPA: tetratricopeptide repeat protein [Thermoanaerobaculia bacterium]|nr:tetratricopeptide repeat protein [Thermoanaerobaculia bacterium]
MILGVLLLAAQTACDRSVFYILRGQYDAALHQLEGAKTSGASPAEVENLRGLALLMKGENAKALVSFDAALKLQPSLAEARFNRALTLLRLGDAAKASPELEKLFADESFPLRAEAAYHNGIALDRLGRAADAEAWLNRARTLDPKLDPALLYIGMLRERRGDLQGAGRAYLDYLKAHPDSAAALLRFGLSAHRAGRLDVARNYLQRVLDTAPDSPEALEARKFLVMWE